nr:MAG TPA: hypothetical protein [Caudoviricetes sp.]
MKPYMIIYRKKVLQTLYLVSSKLTMRMRQSTS